MEQFCDRNGSTVPLKKENAGEYMTIRMEWLVERFRDSRVYSSKGISSEFDCETDIVPQRKTP